MSILDSLKGMLTPKASTSTPSNFNSFVTQFNKPSPQSISTGPVQGPQQQIGPIKPLAPTTPLGPTKPTYTAPPFQGPSYTPEQITNAQIDNRFTNNMNVTPSTTVGAASVSPSNTMTGLLSARQTLEDNYLKSIKGNSNLDNLAKIRNEKATLTERYYNENKNLATNPDGVFGSGVLSEQQRQKKESQNEQLGFLALRETAAQGAVQLDQDQQKNILSSIKEIAGLTNTDLVGSLQKDDVTGEITGFFKDPQTGKITQQKLGSTTPTPNVDYQMVNGQLVAIDKSKPIGSAGSVMKVYGGDTNPEQLANDVNYFAGDYASTGKVPANLPAGITPSMVRAVGASLPKDSGTLVSKNTNVTPANLPAAYTEGLSAMSNINRNILPKMLEIYPKLVTGGGLAGVVGGPKSQDRIDYETYSGMFLNELLKANSGQAVTEQEFARYKGYLPAGLDQLNGNGLKKLNSLTSEMNGSLQSKLDLKGLSIYGYSPVQFNGETHKVGDPVSAGGLQGYIGPDGKVVVPSQEQDFNQAGNAQASNGNRPQRNNNPGNIKVGGLADNYATGTDEQGHLIFPDAQTGLKALSEDISAKVSGNSQHLPANPTIAQLAKVYAEDPQWGAKVASILGVSPSTPTQSVSLSALTHAIATQEGFYA